MVAAAHGRAWASRGGSGVGSVGDGAQSSELLERAHAWYEASVGCRCARVRVSLHRYSGTKDTRSAMPAVARAREETPLPGLVDQCHLPQQYLNLNAARHYLAVLTTIHPTISAVLLFLREGPEHISRDSKPRPPDRCPAIDARINCYLANENTRRRPNSSPCWSNGRHNPPACRRSPLRLVCHLTLVPIGVSENCIRHAP